MEHLHGPQTQVHEGAYAIKVSMRLSLLNSILLIVLVLCTDHITCFCLARIATRRKQPSDILKPIQDILLQDVLMLNVCEGQKKNFLSQKRIGIKWRYIEGSLADSVQES